MAMAFDLVDDPSQGLCRFGPAFWRAILPQVFNGPPSQIGIVLVFQVFDVDQTIISRPCGGWLHAVCVGRTLYDEIFAWNGLVRLRDLEY